VRLIMRLRTVSRIGVRWGVLVCRRVVWWVAAISHTSWELGGRSVSEFLSEDGAGGRRNLVPEDVRIGRCAG